LKQKATRGDIGPQQNGRTLPFHASRGGRTVITGPDVHDSDFPDPRPPGFAPLFERFWDSIVPAHETEAETRFLEQALNLSAPSRILVLPSGGARLALALAARGHAVRGVDSCPDAVGRAQSLAAQAAAAASFTHCPQLSVPDDLPHDAAICLRHGLPAPLVRSLLVRMGAVLAPGGRAVFELAGPCPPLPPTLRLQSLPIGIVGPGGPRPLLVCERV
jgi:SAM-dependent methyltransferase